MPTTAAPEPAASFEPAALPAAADAAAAVEAAAAVRREGQLQRLLQRMQQHADFPSLRESIRRIQSIARSDTVHLRTLTDEVLGDVALTSKLLRMINTAYYGSAGGGSITSLQRAVALMGFQPVAMLASSLTLFDRLPQGADGERVRQQYSRSLMAAMLAHQFCPSRKLEESAYIAAMFQNLGTLLAWMHFPDEALAIESLTASAAAGGDGHEALQAASRQVLGMGYDDLAIEVTRQWGWPPALQANLRRLEPPDPGREASRDEYLRVLCTAANRLAAELHGCNGPEAVEAALEGFRGRYGVALGLDDEAALPAMVERARAQWDELTLVLGLGLGKGRDGAKAKGRADGSRTAASRTGAVHADSRRAVAPSRAPTPAGPAPATAPAVSPAAARTAAPPRRSDPAVAAALGAAVSALSQHAMSEAPLAEVLKAAMDHLRAAMDLQRVVICLRDDRPGPLVGRLGVGERAMQLAPQFRIPVEPPSDLFGLLAVRGADTWISNTADPVIAPRLPAWFREQVRAPAFVLLPLASGGKVLGLIYGDHARAGALSVSEAELALLRALRNQLVMAMRLRGVA